MGEAKQRRNLKAQFLLENPACVYCTGKSETVEHMPPRIMFTRKHRPKGLEFACCKLCNEGTKHADLIAAYIGRSMTQGSGEAETEDLSAILRAIRNNLPDVLLEMRPTADQVQIAQREMPGQRVLSVSGPKVSALMQQFSTKLTFALYREISGRPVPEFGGALVRWFSNYEDRTGRVPPELFQNLMPRRTLKQGKFEVSDQFAFSYEISPEGDFARIVATVRYAFAVAGFIAPTLNWFDDSPGNPVPRGGLLKLSPPAEHR